MIVQGHLAEPFALVTYMKSLYKIRSEIQGKIKCIFFDKLTKKPNLKIKKKFFLFFFSCLAIGGGGGGWAFSDFFF